MLARKYGIIICIKISALIAYAVLTLLVYKPKCSSYRNKSLKLLAHYRCLILIQFWIVLANRFRYMQTFHYIYLKECCTFSPYEVSNEHSDLNFIVLFIRSLYNMLQFL